MSLPGPDEAPSFEAFEASLEIDREPPVPDLTADQVSEVTRLTFRPHEPKSADLFFLFGTHQCDWEGVVRMYRQGLFPTVLLTGRIGPSLYDEGLPLSHHMRRQLLAAGLPEEAILLEDRSMNTLEDVVFAMPILESAGIVPSSILFGAKWHHSGRCYLTLRRFFRDIPVSAFVWPATYGDVVVEPDNWSENEVARSRVYGEYRRILTYSSRGDIARPE